MNTITDTPPMTHEVLERSPQKLSTHEVYAILRQKILEHEIPPATKVNIHHISKELGVSPTPVREALRLLQGDNLLVATSNKGYATTELLDDDQVRNLFEFRLLIEPWATRMAATNSLANPAHFLRDEMTALSLEKDITRQLVVAHDNRFHHAILSATGNTSVVNAYEQSHCHLHLFRLYHLDAVWEVTLDEHQAIVDAIASYDPDAAEKAMRRHLHEAYIRFATRRSTNPNGPSPLDDIPLGQISA
jgi:DNA-binding GntR family transcriptional regulator